MHIERHIEELRAELKWCDDAAEIAQISRELKAALAQKQRRESANAGPVSATE